MQVAFYMAMDLDQAFGGYAAFDLQAFSNGRTIVTFEHELSPIDAEHERKPLPAGRSERKPNIPPLSWRDYGRQQLQGRT
jgi:hypothetical protein